MAGATESKVSAYHGTADGTDVDVVTLTGYHRRYRVLNRSTEALWFVIGTTVPSTTPSADGDNCLCVPGVLGAYVDVDLGEGASGVVVKLFAADSADYSVMGLSY